MLRNGIGAGLRIYNFTLAGFVLSIPDTCYYIIFGIFIRRRSLGRNKGKVVCTDEIIERDDSFSIFSF